MTEDAKQGGKKPGSKKPGGEKQGSKPNPRQARLAEALRANLKRRREQVKRRATMMPEEPGNAGDTAVNPPQTPVKQPE